MPTDYVEDYEDVTGQKPQAKVVHAPKPAKPEGNTTAEVK